jgi:carbon monoxide dehydrogenase subunit G
MKFSHQMRYDAPPAEVHAMLADPVFREKVAEAGGAFERTVRINANGSGMSVVVDQKQHDHNIPAFAKKIVGDAIHIVQEEHWADDANASLDVAIPGKPGHMKGTVTLSPDGRGTVESVDADIKVHLPLVGGKLEKLIANLLEAALKSEQRVGEAWLRGER